MTYSDGVCCTARVIFPVISSITPRVIEICTISALQVTVTLAGLPGEVTAVEAVVRRAMLVRDVGRRDHFCLLAT